MVTWLGAGCAGRPEESVGGESTATREPARSEVAGAPPADSAQEETGPGAGDAPAVRDVVLITIDTLRWDALGFGGNDRVETPALDRLAASGWIFDNAHAHNVVTLPSHANILTGLYPYQHGVRDNSGFVLPDTVPTLATVLSARGFATGAFVGAFPLDARFGLARGFEVYDDRVSQKSATAIAPRERRGDEVVRLAGDWWRRAGDRRRFLWLHLFDPHAPYEPPPPFAARFATERYLGEVSAVDSFLAPLLEELTGAEAASALVVFTADHGEALGDHGERTHGVFAYESTLKVPLVLWAPSLAPKRSELSARHVDILPTALEAAGVEPPGDLAGRSLWGVAGKDVPVSSYLEAMTPALDRGWAPLRGVFDGRFKLIALPLPELYDLDDDPGEESNLFEARRDLGRELARELPAESIWPPDRSQVSSEVSTALRALGYLGGDAASKSEYGVADDPKRLIHLDDKMHRVIDAYERGRFDLAAALAEEVIAERPDMAAAHYYLAQTLLEAGRSEQALAALIRARDANATTPALLRQLGLSLAEAGRFQEAANVLTPLAQSGEPEALNALGLVLSEAGDQSSAAEVLTRVFDRDPENAKAHESLAIVALRRGDWLEAERQARTANAEDAGLDLAWSYLGSALYQQGRRREALAAWDQALALELRNWDALFNVAVVARELGEAVRARDALERFIAGAPPAAYGPDLAKARAWLRQLG